jgi:uncharacterized protein
MLWHKVSNNPQFIGREFEISRLNEITSLNEASFIIVYGRRRVGKTELIEQYFKKQHILKFEGIEILNNKNSAGRYATKMQILQCQKRLAKYLESPLIEKINCTQWTDFFELLSETVSKKKVVLYFEEIQWLSEYKSSFFSELKPFWDDQWRTNKNLTLILCGSSPSFIMQQLISNKALYSRAKEEIHLKPFNLMEIKAFFPKLGLRELLQAQLSVGGICEYLKQLKGKDTVLQSLCNKSFSPNSFFSIEQEKIFVSSMAKNKNYQKIIELLSQRKFANINEIEKICGVKSGGSLTDLILDLEKCGLIQKYSALHKKKNSKLVRYTISDEYLRFYYQCIHPLKTKIEQGDFLHDPLKALNRIQFNQLLGYSFENWCRKNHFLFAKIMGFHGLEYTSGSFFDKKSEHVQKGFQIDLMYIIKGSKIIICEIKYWDITKHHDIFKSILQKKELFLQSSPQYKNYTFETVLITSQEENPKDKTLTVFDHVITLTDIFQEKYWF